MTSQRYSRSRLLLALGGSLLAGALMLRLSPTESSLAAFALWAFFFAALQAPRGTCWGLRFRSGRP